MFIRQRVDAKGRHRFEAVESFRTPEGPRQRILATWSSRSWRWDGTPAPEGPLATLLEAITDNDACIESLRQEQRTRRRAYRVRDGEELNWMRDQEIPRLIERWTERAASLREIADRLRSSA